MIDLKHEIERELSLIDPPDLWDRIQADASNNGGAAVLDLTTARPGGALRGGWPWPPSRSCSRWSAR